MQKAWAMRISAIAALAACCLGGGGTKVIAQDSFESMRLERMHRDDGDDRVRTERPVSAPRQRVERHGAYRDRERVREVRGTSTTSWTVASGHDLRQTLSEWCARQGWTLTWKSDFTYEMTTTASFSGSFEDAVKAVIVSMKDVRPSPTVEMYGANKVLVVANQGSGVTD